MSRLEASEDRHGLRSTLLRRQEEPRELVHDLMASWALTDAPELVEDWMTRPSVLRRVAALLAYGIPAGVDRIVAAGPGAATLGTAVSLSTGLPFVALFRHPGSDADEVTGVSVPTAFGRPRAGEKVAVLSALHTDAHDTAAFLVKSDLAVAAWQIVLAQGVHGECSIAGTQPTALFYLDQQGTLDVRNGPTA